MTRHKIAVIAGDGIGKEVVPEGIRVLDAAGRKFGFEFQWDELPWSCDYYVKHGRMMPEDGLEQIRQHEAIFLGAVGLPALVPDHISLWGLLIKLRRGFEQYANIRPVRLMPGIRSPLADRMPGDIDFIVVRENNEGEYSVDRRPQLRGHGRGGGAADEHLHPPRRRPDHALRLRARRHPAGEARHLGHQVERRVHRHALLGRALQGDGGAATRTSGPTSTTSTS